MANSTTVITSIKFDESVHIYRVKSSQVAIWPFRKISHQAVAILDSVYRGGPDLRLNEDSKISPLL